MKQINSLSDFHMLLHLPKPLHPLVSVVLVSELHIKNTEYYMQKSLSLWRENNKNTIINLESFRYYEE